MIIAEEGISKGVKKKDKTSHVSNKIFLGIRGNEESDEGNQLAKRMVSYSIFIVILGGLFLLEGFQCYNEEQKAPLEDTEQLLSYSIPEKVYMESEVEPPSYPRMRRGSSSNFFGLSGPIFGPRKSRENPVSMFRLKKSSSSSYIPEQPMDKRMSMIRLKKNLRKLHSNVSMLRLRKRISQMRLRKRFLEDHDNCEGDRKCLGVIEENRNSKRTIEEPENLYGLMDYESLKK
ncbi:uncharacterized protein [Lepeophtheirus salmonis]|uniref:uncharacterized protein n=1 Tax=Lepeophtheirus salmonis TaxID=72036 RepID=UPI003AF3CE82